MARRAPLTPNVRHFIGFQALSVLGDRVAQVSVPIAILALTESPSAAGAVAAANQFPGFLTAVGAGRLADRRSRKQLSVVSDLARAGLYVILGVLFLGDSISLPLVIVLMFIVGVFDTLAGIAHYSWLPSLSSGTELVRANEVLEGSDAAMTIVGPPLGGVLIDLIGRSAGVLVNGVTFLVSAIGLSRLPSDALDVEEEDSGGASRAGWDLIVRNRDQRSLQLMLSGTFLTTGALVLIALTLGFRDLDLSATVTSLAVTGAGVGGLVAAFWLSPRVERVPLRHVCTAIYAATAAAFGLIAVANGIVILFLAMLVADCAITMSFIVLATVRQSITPDAVIGRVAGMSSTLNALIATVAAGLAGLLMREIGAGATAVFWAALLVPAILGSLSASFGQQPLHQLAARTNAPPSDSVLAEGAEDSAQWS